MSCVGEPFLSVSASAPRHDAFIDLELGVVDPIGRLVGKGEHTHKIPRSHYGKIIEIPSHPETSKALAIEICGATPGRYLLTVSEHGSYDYRLSLGADDGTGSNQGNEGASLLLHADGNRQCRYRFNFSIEGSRVAIRLLDQNENRISFDRVTCDPVPIH